MDPCRTNTRIDRAGPDDAGELLALIRELAAYERLSHLVVASEHSIAAELAAERPVIEALLIREGDAAVGFALFFQNYSTFLGRRGLYLEDLYVRPEARGRGHGKALMRRLAQLAVERGCGRFEWAVLDWNQPAIDFYRSLGADVLPDWRICRLAGDALLRFGEAGAGRT